MTLTSPGKVCINLHTARLLIITLSLLISRAYIPKSHRNSQPEELFNYISLSERLWFRPIPSMGRNPKSLYHIENQLDIYNTVNNLVHISLKENPNYHPHLQLSNLLTE